MGRLKFSYDPTTWICKYHGPYYCLKVYGCEILAKTPHNNDRAMAHNWNVLRQYPALDDTPSETFYSKERLHSTRAILAARHRPSLLYITPVCPTLTGSGTPMRAGIVLEALCQRYRVSLLVVPGPQYQGFPRELPESLRRVCESVNMVSYDGDVPQRISRGTAVYRDYSFEAIHVFRLTALPYARPYLTATKGTARHYLDLDDIESKTQKRVAALHRRAGNEALAAQHEQNAKRCAMLETVAFRTFDRVYVCSAGDREDVLSRCAGVEASSLEVCVLRNAVRLPEAAPRRPFRFLFVGTLGYFPNEDAVRYFCARILPLIRDQADGAVFVDIVGRDAEGLRDLRVPGVTIVGQVADLAPYYEACDAVIVPLRAGGGTRIKILEAFSFRRPVVTTAIGMEGIEAVPNEHLLVGDEPEDFAAACLQLMLTPDLGQFLVENASEFLETCHTVQDLKRTIEAIPDSRPSLHLSN